MTAAPAPAPAPSSPTPSSAPRSEGPRRDRPQQRRPRTGGGGRPNSGPAQANGRPGRVTRQIRRTLRRDGPNKPMQKKGADYFPEDPGSNVVRIVPLGGVEEVGRNMFCVDANGDIFVFDVGFQFVSEGDTPGVDYILPNTKYLEERKLIYVCSE